MRRSPRMASACARGRAESAVQMRALRTIKSASWALRGRIPQAVTSVARVRADRNVGRSIIQIVMSIARWEGGGLTLRAEVAPFDEMAPYCSIAPRLLCWIADRDLCSPASFGPPAPPRRLMAEPIPSELASLLAHPEPFARDQAWTAFVRA